MPLFDLLLLSVIVVTAYLGPMVLRRLGPGQRLYAWMLLGDLALAIGALASRRADGEGASADVVGLLGSIAIGGGICLVVVPPILRNLARRALVADHLRVARALVDAREMLQPGMGARQESELISTILEVRSGQVEAAVGRLRERRDQMAEPLARRPLDERIVMTYLYARRWEDAVSWFEQNIEGPLLPLSPQLSVEMVRAYCERGELLKAAALVERLEGAPSMGEPIWSLLIHRARLVFLAFAGRTAAVDAIVAPSGPLGAMPESARCFWTGMARLKAGDRSGARDSLERSAALSGRDERSREQAQSTLSRLDDPGVAGPLAVPDAVADLADRLSRLTEDRARGETAEGADAGGERSGAATAGRDRREARAPRLTGVGWREVPVTSAMLAANLVVAAAMALFAGDTADLGALIDFGANVKNATAAGDWWRLVSSNFLHVGFLHLALNMYGLWVLGRLVEQFVGPTRMLILYVATGVCGAGASLAFGGPATSAGASGAVFGLLGAAVAELGLHRKVYPRRWSSALLGNLLFLAGANVAIGFMYPMIDQSAHLGGLAAGIGLGALLSRKLSIASAGWMRGLVTALAAAAVGALVYGVYGAATGDFSARLASYPRVARTLAGLEVMVPESWQQVTPNQVDDPSLAVLVHLQHLAGPTTPAMVEARMDQRAELERTEGAKQLGLVGVRQVADTALALPTPWRSRELVGELEAGVAGEQSYRIAIVAREYGGDLWLGSIYYPASLGDDLSPTLSEVLGTARPGRPAPAAKKAK